MIRAALMKGALFFYERLCMQSYLFPGFFSGALCTKAVCPRASKPCCRTVHNVFLHLAVPIRKVIAFSLGLC